jgi:DNA-binding NarL/FixJ family response regulator
MDGGGRAVLVVEDDPMTLGLLAQSLAQAGFTVGAAATAAQARDLWERMAPEAVVLDIDLGPGASGLDLADALLAQAPGLAVLFLSALPDARFAGRDPRTLPAGAGYVRKDRITQALIDALHAVLHGSARDIPRQDRDPDRPLAGLSRTQVAVLRMVALGMTNKQLADQRGTTPKAVGNVLARTIAHIDTTDTPETPEGSTRVTAAREFIRAAGLPNRH